ncbi:hypothetical protein HNQ68_002342 [Pseudochrobactrum saccharolyticum]|uniref:Uncharacterized protein n=1 Tax=Pseudochrobactrum saccharolyticum TaxID=354352 RepID=A0A7W8AK19_9HYPH|nr:hypothetical protein [Pseudochrobactrum saccharolyticum]
MCDDADVAEKTSYGPPFLNCVELLRNLSNRFFADKSYPQQKTAGNSGGFYQFLSLLTRTFNADHLRLVEEITIFGNRLQSLLNR